VALDVAARIGTLDRELFSGPNQRVHDVRGTRLADRVRFAARAIADGHYRRAVTALELAVGWIDERPRPPAWMTDSEVKAEYGAAVGELIVRVEAESGG
jgi:hypothetical protein